jgi:peptidoglycan/LPS O-acetylase OafA/YrhL
MSLATFSAIAATFAIFAITVPKLVPYAYLHSGVLLPLYVALIAGLAASDAGLSWILSRRPIVALGHASYATYILHVPLFLLIARWDRSLWTSASHFAAYGAALLALSLAARRWIEEPLRRAIVARFANAPKNPA